MSAKEIIDQAHTDGFKVQSFRSYCGGLMAQGHDDNPFRYKFTWNPRNVVLAGQGTPARYLEDGQLKIVNYLRLFEQTEPVSIQQEDFVSYANRNALPYNGLYDIPEVETLYRGTLRRPGYCSIWQGLLKTGFTDDQTAYAHELKHLTWRQLSTALGLDKQAANNTLLQSLL